MELKSSERKLYLNGLTCERWKIIKLALLDFLSHWQGFHVSSNPDKVGKILLFQTRRFIIAFEQKEFHRRECSYFRGLIEF